jgi:flagellar secretion chaperone FliS
MFAAYQNAAASYRGLAAETGVTDASPHQLIAMLYDGAIGAIQTALYALNSGDIAGRGNAITKAIRIINEGLKASLDPRGGEITVNLGSLYDYATKRLLHANLHADAKALEEVIQVINQLREGWRGIGPQARQ